MADPDFCLSCGSDEFAEIGRIEAGELGWPDDPPVGQALRKCLDCSYEWEVGDE